MADDESVAGPRPDTERLTATEEPGPAATQEAGLASSAGGGEGAALVDEDRDVGEAGEPINASLTTPVEHEKVETRDLSGGGEIATPRGPSATG